MKLKILIAILIAAFSAQSVMAQHMTGCEIDTVLAKKLPMRAAMTRDITTSLPKAVSLQKFTPIPGDQGQTGTCTAWSSTYCIATMLWAMKNGITNRATITKNAFLPCYTYVNILTVSTTNCAVGTDIAQACAWLKNTGAVKLSLYPQNPSCISTNAIPSNWKSLAASNRIPNYTKLFLNYNNLLMKVTSTKQALAAGHPVLAAFKCPPSMSSSTGMLSDGTWNPSENPNVNYGGHALAVVAYDDALFGGSGGFLVQNSWGTSWGKSGYFWCSYYTYACWCYYAFEVHSQMSSSVSVDKSIANLNFGTSTNEYDYRDRNDYNNNYNNDNNNKYDNNKIDNNKNDNNKNDGKYVLVDEDWLKKIADQYGLNYNDFVKNNNNNNNNNNGKNNNNNNYNNNNYNNYNNNNYNNYNNNNNNNYNNYNNNNNNYSNINSLDDINLDGFDIDYNDNDNYADFSDNNYNKYYNDGDDGSWNGYTDNDYTDYDYNYGNNNYDYSYTNSSYDQNIKASEDNSVNYDNDNSYDKEFCKSSKLHIKTPDGKKLLVSKLSGNIKLMLNDNTLMPGKINGKVITMDNTYKSGTRFRIYVGNNQPAYVYVFGTDLSNKVYHIFPQSRLISPYLDYVNSRVAFPDEKHWIEMDQTTGTDYLYVLYSLVPLNIYQIEEKMEQIKGDFENKLFTVLGPKTFSLNEAESSGTSTFRFNAMSVKKETLGVVVKFSHTK